MSQLWNRHVTILQEAVVGHLFSPTFTNFANQFTTDYIDNIPTCGIVRYDLNAEKWADFKEKTTLHPEN